MKSLITPFLLLAFLVHFESTWAAKTLAGEKVEISNTVNEDLYVAGQNILVTARVNGDIIAAGADLEVTDSIYGDAMLAGGNIDLYGFVIDDIRIAGGTIHIYEGAGSDIIVFGGTVVIHDEAIIRGDIIIFGGEVAINGKVEGDITAFSGELELNAEVAQNVDIKCGDLFIGGVISGDAVIAAEDIELGTDAKIDGELRYWTSNGEMNFGSAAPNAVFDPSLEIEGEIDHEDSVFGAIGFFFISFFSSVLLIILLVLAFGKYFERGARIAKADFLKSFGFGTLYVIALPVLIIILMISVIGIPLALLTLVFFIFTLVFASTIASVLIANWMNQQYNQSWNKLFLILVSAAIFIILWLIMMIPFAGWLFGIVVIGTAFGAIISAAFEKKTVSE